MEKKGLPRCVRSRPVSVDQKGNNLPCQISRKGKKNVSDLESEE